MRAKTLCRLHPIDRFIPLGSTVADIGCDHGLLPMLCREKCKKIIGTDINKHSVEKAKLATRGVTNIEIIQGSGLSPLLRLGLHAQPDTLVLSGMGAGLIQTILTEEETRINGVGKVPLLQMISPQRIIIQPAPVYIKQELALHHALLQRGWEHCDQDILNIKHRCYITTLFEYRGISKNMGSPPIAGFNNMLSLFPMAVKTRSLLSHEGPARNPDLPLQLSAWNYFLLRQKSLLAIKLSGHCASMRRHAKLLQPPVHPSHQPRHHERCDHRRGSNENNTQSDFDTLHPNREWSFNQQEDNKAMAAEKEYIALIGDILRQVDEEILFLESLTADSTKKLKFDLGDS